MPWTPIDANNGITLTIGHIGTNEDLLRNCFQGASAPASPVTGQLWWDTANAKLNTYNGSTWVAHALDSELTTAEAAIAALQGLSVNATAVATAGTSEESTRSYTIPAGFFGTNGKGLEFEAVVTTAANANNKQVSIDFGGTTIADATALLLNDATILIRGRIWRRASNSQIAIIEIESDDALLPRTVVFATATETDAGTIVLALRLATPDNAGDATCQIFRVAPLP